MSKVYLLLICRLTCTKFRQRRSRDPVEALIKVRVNGAKAHQQSDARKNAELAKRPSPHLQVVWLRAQDQSRDERANVGRLAEDQYLTSDSALELYQDEEA